MTDAARLPFPPVVLGIAGCSGSGKTTLARELARSLQGTHFHLDSYYRDLSEMSYTERCLQDFDSPELLESDLLVKHIADLAQGRSVDRPVYDFASYTRVPGQTDFVEPGRLLLIDGIFSLYYEGLLPLYNLSIYVDTPDAVCYERRLARDIRERGRTAESVAAQYAATVRPSAEKFVRPTATRADLIVDGTLSVDWSVEQVMRALEKRNLLAGLSQ